MYLECGKEIKLANNRILAAGELRALAQSELWPADNDDNDNEDDNYNDCCLVNTIACQQIPTYSQQWTTMDNNGQQQITMSMDENGRGATSLMGS